MKASVDFPDAALEAAIRSAIRKPKGDICKSDLEQLTKLAAPEKNISDLTGLEYAAGLTELGLGDNHISDILPLANLINLKELDLHNNLIGDASTSMITR